MATDPKTQQLNTFTKGMNTDVSDTLLDSSQYRLANNVRFVTDTDENSGELYQINGTTKVLGFDDKILATASIRDFGVIIFEKSYNANDIDMFDNVIPETGKYWYIVRMQNPYTDKDIQTKDQVYEINNVKLVFGPCKEQLPNNKLSLSTRYEDEENIKLYIADGKHSIMSMNIMKNNGNEIGNILSYPSVYFNPPIFQGLIQGKLRAGLVQYSFSLYERKGRQTEISPATKLISIVNQSTDNNDVKSLIGLEKGKISSSGVKIKINIPNEVNSNLFEYMQIYRTYYVDTTTPPTIEVIYDGKYTKDFTFQDVGQNALSTLTVEEYNSVSGIHIIPKVIESKNDILFAANIKQELAQIDKFEDFDARTYSFGPKSNNSNPRAHLYDFASNTQLQESGQNGVTLDYIKNTGINQQHDCYNKYNDLSQIMTMPDNINTGYQLDDIDLGNYDRFDTDGYYGGEGINIKWRFIITNLVGDASKGELDRRYNNYGTAHNTTSYNDYQPFSRVSRYYVKEDGTYEAAGTSTSEEFFGTYVTGGRTYANPIVSYALRSLRRDEVYRYGIVLYDKSGNASPVKWIQDIRTPSIHTKGFYPFVVKQLWDPANLYDLTVKPLGIEFKVSNLPEDCAYYEIVRCNRTDSDIATITQGVVSRPITKTFSANYTGEKKFAYLPTGLLTTARYAAYDKDYARNTDRTEDGNDWDNFGNDSIFQFISAESTYLKDSLQLQMKDKNLYISPQLYLYGARGHSNNYVPAASNVIPKATVHAATTNANLIIGGNGFDNEHEQNYYKLTKSDGSTIWLRGGKNAKYRLLQTYKYTWMSFYTTDEHYAFHGLFTSKYFSYSKPTKEPLINIDPQGGDSNIVERSNWYEVSDNSYSYIKLYQASPDVILRGHKKGHPDTDVVGVTSDDKPIENTPRRVKSYNKCSITDFNIASELGWDDFGALSSSNNQQPVYNLKYIDSIVPIGDVNFCNWVCSTAYDRSVNDMTKTDNQIDDGNKNVLMGPGGRCLLLHIDNDWDIPYTSVQSSSEYELLADTIGTDSMMRFSGSEDSISVIKRDSLKLQNPTAYATDTDYDKIEQAGNEWTFFKDSVAGTYLCNIRQDVVPYGGYDYNSRKLNSYYSYGDFHKKSDNTVNVFNGDCFILPLEYVSLHKYYHNIVQKPVVNTIIYSIPVETNINLAYTYGYEFGMNYNNSNITKLQIQPSTVNSQLVQKTPLYQYNSAYSTYPKAKIFSSYDDLNYNQTQQAVDYRCIYSGTKSNNEISDSWIKFKPANYLDVDTRFGEITHLRTFKNSLLFWQDEAMGILSVNERTTLTDSSNQQLILGTGGVLSRYDYVTTSNGMRRNEYVDAQSPTTLYWWDHSKHEICAYSGGVQYQIISKIKNVQNFLNKQHKEDTLLDDPHMTYDNKYNEILASVSAGKKHEYGTLVYNENIQAFTGLYSMSINNDISFHNKLYITDNNSIFEWDIKDIYKNGTIYKCMDNNAVPYVKYVVNQNSQYVKVFDNITFGGTFTNIHNNLFFTFNTPLDQKSSNYVGDITDREYDYRLAIPRNNNSEYGDRMRGKTMQCEITEIESNTKFSLQYIITKYRISWS